MLILRKIQVKNFRSIRSEEFELPVMSVLVGKNDVGKSNVLEAIRILLEGSGSDIKGDDFYGPTEAIEITGIFEGAKNYLKLCDAQNRSKVEQRIDADGLLTIRRISKGAGTLGKIEIYDAGSNVFGTPTGIDAALKPMLPEVIPIEALADVGEEVKGTQKDALGKLVGQIVASVTSSVQPSLESAYEEAHKQLNVQMAANGTAADERVKELREIEAEITNYVKETFPTTAVRLKVNLPSVKEILGSIDVLISEGKQTDPYYRRGHGLQRALYLSLLRALAARIRQSQEEVVRPFILLFEEPEAFLHPEGQMKMRNALEAISTKAQVVLATHSPIMVTPASMSKVIRMEKRTEAGLSKPVTKRFGPIDPAKLSGLEKELLRLLAIQRSSRFLFARGVLLVEGEGDEHIFAAISARLGRQTLEANEIAIVETGGKDSIAGFAELLRMLNLRVWALTDVDFLWNGAGKILGGHPGLSQFCSKLDELLSASLPKDIGEEERKRIEKEKRKEICCGELKAARDVLCEELRGKGVYVLRHGEMEDYVGLGQSSKGQYMKAAEQIRNGSRNVNHVEEFEALLKDIEDLPT